MRYINLTSGEIVNKLVYHCPLWFFVFLLIVIVIFSLVFL